MVSEKFHDAPKEVPTILDRTVNVLYNCSQQQQNFDIVYESIQFCPSISNVILGRNAAPFLSDSFPFLQTE